MNIYHRKDDGTLGKVHVADAESHSHAILEVCEHLVEHGQGYNQPVLAVIEGGSKE